MIMGRSGMTFKRLLAFLFLLVIFLRCTEKKQGLSHDRTQVVLLGTGTPNADPDRSGPSLAIVVDDVSYIVDCGPGVVRRAAAAGLKGVEGLNPNKLNRLFITHLHSDHTTGYADFILTPAVLERAGPVEVFGPKGIKEMNDHILAAYRQDYDIRIFGLEKGDSLAYKVNVHELQPGIIYKDSLVEVHAFSVKHGSWEEAYGFKFTTPDKSIVVSGDCTYSESVAQMCNGCDILVHEVYSVDGYSRRPEKWKVYHKDFHTSSLDLAKLANQAKPKLLVLTHQLIWDSTEEKLLEEIRSGYAGKVVSGKDLDIF
jgi:ribonuclease BN (tRNA processing enzyme)